MGKPILVCTADLADQSEVCAMLDSVFDVRRVDCSSFATLTVSLRDAEAYFAGLGVRLTAELIDAAPRLKVIATPSTGLDHLDLQAAGRRGISVLSLKNERALLDRITATAELTWALVLSCARRLPAAFDAAREGCWARDALRGHQLAGKTMGIIGCGRLGSIVAEYARAFRMRVLGYDVGDVQSEGIAFVGLDELLALSDVVSLHIHLTDENRGFLSRKRLHGMKTGSILVNTSRGAVVDENAVLDALNNGSLAAYGTDVITGEWQTDLRQHPFVRYANDHDNLVITPHIGGVTFESQAMAYSHTARLLIDHWSLHHADIATVTANRCCVSPACSRETVHPVPKAPTLADRLGVTVHESPLRFKIRRLMRLYRAPASCSIEDWLVELANRRGARVVFRPDSMPPAVRFPEPVELSPEELVVALCQMNCLDRPQMLRLAAQIISRNECDLGTLLRCMRMERATRVFKQLAQQALKVDSAHPAWLALQKALRNERELSQPLLHWTRLAEPQFASRTANPIDWKLVS